MKKLNLSDLQKVATLYDFKVKVSYDTDLANLYYDVFKEGHMGDNINLFFDSRQTDYLVIIENEKVLNESYYKRYKLARMNKDELHGLNYYHELLWGDETLLKSELIENLLSISNEEYYKNHYENEDYYYLEHDFTVKGYNQGDCVKVKLVGNVDKWINKEYLTHLFYDTPISGNIEVFKNGSLIDDFNLYGLENFNEYDYYNKDKLISIIADYCSDKDYKDLLVTYLNDNLNDIIDYDY